MGKYEKLLQKNYNKIDNCRVNPGTISSPFKVVCAGFCSFYSNRQGDCYKKNKPKSPSVFRGAY
ncbi:hypothetical protein [Aphanothece sacrum]|uniref:hypothetical protein n=1 Tax=Aphanothece sacrum TaxID=1122 RepID=UPI000F611005|nr:hypothetical protein [Aphanothece sacrum]